MLIIALVVLLAQFKNATNDTKRKVILSLVFLMDFHMSKIDDYIFSFCNIILITELD